jgi:hypothetical protein
VSALSPHVISIVKPKQSVSKTTLCETFIKGLNMRRGIPAIILGVVFPAIWLILTGVISYLVFLPPLTDFRINGELVPGLLFMPVLIPVYFDILMRQYGILPSMFASIGFRVLSLILFNWIVYGIIFYLLLGKLNRFKNKQ